MPTKSNPPPRRASRTDTQVPLGLREQRFVREYLIDLNGAAAVLRAGYKQTPASARVTASRLLIKANVKAAVAEGQKRQIQASEVKADRVIQELARVAFADIRDLLDDDWNVRPMSEWANGIAQAVSTIDANGSSITRVRFHDKLSALGLLAKHFQLLPNQPVSSELIVRWADDE